MKNLKLIFAALLFLSTFTLVSCSEDDVIDTPEVLQETILQKAGATSDLSILVDALTQTGLLTALEGDGPFTVFAPTNQAFQDLLDSNPAWNTLSDIDNATLTSVLLFHVLPTELMAKDLTDDYQVTLSEGPNMEGISLKIGVTGGVTFDDDANPLTTDIDARNGVIHTIDKVMLPPSVVDLALENDAFSSLVAALTRPDLTIDFVSILSGSGPFTVFAPTNQAFDNLLMSNMAWNTLADIPVATLEAVLQYHVVDGANVQADELQDNQNVTTLGGSLTVDLSGSAKLESTSGQSVNIIITDVQGTNGVVHAIDEVLIP